MRIRIEELRFQPVNPLDRTKWFGLEVEGEVDKDSKTLSGSVQAEKGSALGAVASTGSEVEGSVESLKGQFRLDSPNRDGEDPPDGIDFARLPVRPENPSDRDALRPALGDVALAAA